jgi:hypothetical protein
MRIFICYLDCHEAGLCCYLLTHIENLLRPLQLFYFHLWSIYWLSLVYALGPRTQNVDFVETGLTGRMNSVVRYSVTSSKLRRIGRFRFQRNAIKGSRIWERMALSRHMLLLQC